MFGRKKKPSDGRALNEFLTGFVRLHTETEQMKEAARSNERSVAVLRPQIPIGRGPTVGWFGGNASLPEGIAWPEKDGKRQLFVGQIDLSALPRDLWSGAGPRKGWLGIFLSEDWPPRPTVLHFDGMLRESDAPQQRNASWASSHDFETTKTFVLPKWPVVVEILPGNELHLRDATDPVEGELQGTLLDPAYQPFDQATVSLLCAALEDAVTRQAREIVRFPAMKKLRQEDAVWFKMQRPRVINAFQRFFELEGQMRSAWKPDQAQIATFVEGLAQLEAYDAKYIRNDDEGYCELEIRETKLLDPQPNGSELRSWWNRYEAGLKSHALKAYTSNAAVLPAPLRERLERSWKSEARHGFAAMGHAPEGHIYTPHGPDSPNEVLIELHTSELAGWIWGDCHSLVLLIDRAALQAGDFSAVTFDITN